MLKRSAAATPPRSRPGRRRRTANGASRARRLQVRRLRGRVSRRRLGDRRAAARLRADVRGAAASPRHRLRPRRAAGGAQGCRRQRPRHRPQHRDGRRRARARPRRDRRRRARLPLIRGRRIARRHHRDPGRRASRAVVSDAPARRRRAEARAGRADRARNDQPGLLAGVLQQLHPRFHARPPRAPGDAAVPAARERVRTRRDSLQRAGAGPDEDENGGSPADMWRRPSRRRRRRYGSPMP